MSDSSLLSYYQKHRVNPVPIDLEEQAAWDLHFVKRRNLYERHLGVPLSLLKDRSVLELGCNSGENALVQASLGAKLTLVEPNEQVHPRLKTLFRKFGLENSIVSLIQESVEDYNPQDVYGLVIAEGFLNHLKARDMVLQKICSFVAQNGLGIISFDDRYGHFLEIARKFIFHRVLHLSGINEIHSENSLDLARNLYLEDFEKLNASRPFVAWWQDVLLNPFVSWEYLWSYQDVLPIIEEGGCEFYCSSPKWVSTDDFSWYKNTLDRKKRHQAILEEWKRMLSFLLTGLPPRSRQVEPVSDEVIGSVSNLVKQMSSFVALPGALTDAISYPGALDDYFKASNEAELLGFNEEMKRVLEAANSSDADGIVNAYKSMKILRKLWGAPYHYISFIKPV